jgi:hypothetical protein
MRVLSGIFTSLFRPARGIDSLGDALKWLWIPLAIILATSVVAKAVVATPMQTVATQEATDAALKAQLDQMPEADRAQVEKDMGEGGVVDAVSSIANTAAIVFGVVGAFAALLYVATFFFVAAKTWAMPVKYTSLLSIAGLALLPHAMRNVIQTIYMTSTGVWLQHAGLGALVAPKDIMTAPSAPYAVLSQIDLWVVWGIVILFGAMLSKTVGLEKKRAVAAVLAFVVITGVMQAVPTIVTGVFMGGSSTPTAATPVEG